MKKISEVTSHFDVNMKELNSALVAGFDQASVTGPLMDEPI